MLYTRSCANFLFYFGQICEDSVQKVTIAGESLILTYFIFKNSNPSALFQ
jgi:hypothetical protein